MPTIYTDKLAQLPERIDKDFYPTPEPVVLACLSFVSRLRAYTPETVLDVGAGDGVWGRVASQLWPKAHITGVELRDVKPAHEYGNWFTLDYLQWASANAGLLRFDLIMGNPWYSAATEVVLASLPLLRGDQSQLTFLLPENFMWSADRYERIFRDKRPNTIAAINPRIPFTAGSNPNLSALYIWRRYSALTVFDWIEWRPPKKVRQYRKKVE